ncbi:aldehyde dehydrogenase family protein [Caviibacter abscessus]|uniref:aldehyde dehydrogenase family protein n=1 Tax=Caviibacter abscessus TaxID=1766719 RepID=UPI00082F392D|nr:aldehyde dehydrogenase family protein [Caviibacter abscessus]
MDDIKIYSPVDNSYLGSTKSMSTDEIEKSIQELLEAFKSYSNISITERVKCLKNVAKELESQTEELSKILAMEISKPYKACVDEIKRSVEMIYYTIEEGLRIESKVYEGDSYGVDGKIAIAKREPLGIVLCIAPFNYPINLSVSKIVPALITGNVVLFKPPTQGSISATKLADIFIKHMPKNTIKLATGKGSVIGDFINQHEDIKYINFTGSTQIGKQISFQAGMKGIMLELGGKDAAIVLSDADIDKCAKDIVSGAFSYSGQRCTAIKRVLVVNEVADELTDKIQKHIQNLKVGNPLNNCDITPLIDSKSADFVEGLIVDAIKKGSKLVIGNKREGNIIYPTLLDNVTLDMKVAFEEPFGPVLPIIRVKDEMEAIKIANMSQYGLQSSVYTKDMKKAFEIAKQLEVGTVQINNKTQRGPDNFPFLGIKDSGIGVQGIRNSIISMTKIKSIVFDM